MARGKKPRHPKKSFKKPFSCRPRNPVAGDGLIRHLQPIKEEANVKMIQDVDSFRRAAGAASLGHPCIFMREGHTVARSFAGGRRSRGIRARRRNVWQTVCQPRNRRQGLQISHQIEKPMPDFAHTLREKHSFLEVRDRRTLNSLPCDRILTFSKRACLPSPCPSPFQRCHRHYESGVDPQAAVLCSPRVQISGVEALTVHSSSSVGKRTPDSS